MRPETMAIHSGDEPESSTRADAMPIYRTVAYAFDSAEHGEALVNVETGGCRYCRIDSPPDADPPSGAGRGDNGEASAVAAAAARVA